MEDLFRSYWWLLFPIAGFAFAGFDRYLSYRRYRDHLDLMKTYAAQGKEPPPEVLRVATAPDPDSESSWDRRWDRRRCERGPRHEMRRVILFSTLAAAFYYAAFNFGHGDRYEPFMIVAVVMTALAVGAVLMLVMSSLWKGK
jgi:hypothetical protein